MYQITDRLYVSDWPEAKSADPREFVKVTVAFDSPFVGDYHFHLVDGLDENNDVEYPLACLKARELLESDTRKVVVHCVVGRSRSAAVAVGALVLGGMDFIEAIRLVRQKHPKADPRWSLMENLFRWGAGVWPERLPPGYVALPPLS